MFGVDSSELLVVAVLALIFIGPKDLPRVLHTVGRFYGRARGMARHFTSGIENMMREAELEEMEKRWREENERIMKLHPGNLVSPEPDPATTMLPKPPPAAGTPDAMPPIAATEDWTAPAQPPAAPAPESEEEPQLPLPSPPSRPLP